MSNTGPRPKTPAEMRADLDPVKRMVSMTVQHAVLTGPERIRPAVRPAVVADVTGVAITALVSEIRVTLGDGSVRTFLCKLSETDT